MEKIWLALATTAFFAFAANGYVSSSLAESRSTVTLQHLDPHVAYYRRHLVDMGIVTPAQ